MWIYSDSERSTLHRVWAITEGKWIGGRGWGGDAYSAIKKKEKKSYQVIKRHKGNKHVLLNKIRQSEKRARV